MSKELSVGELLTIINSKIQPSITIKNREIWQTNITYAFISNLDPHVFGRLYFLQDMCTNTWGHHKKVLSNTWLRYQITKTSSEVYTTSSPWCNLNQRRPKARPAKLEVVRRCPGTSQSLGPVGPWLSPSAPPSLCGCMILPGVSNSSAHAQIIGVAPPHSPVQIEGTSSTWSITRRSKS